MKLLVSLSALLAVGLAEETQVVSAAATLPYTGYSYPTAAAVPQHTVATPVAPNTVVSPVSTPNSQFHAQDELGNLHYGYSTPLSAKAESGNTYSGVSGGYSYLDAGGVLQQVQYVADDAGFRVADSRLPTAPVYNGVSPVA